MAAGNGPYLVIRLEDGFGEVFPLEPGQRYTLGRAGTNRIVLPDDLASREHAEVYFADGHWRLRDLKSLNGTRLKGHPVEGEEELTPGDEFQVGRTVFLHVTSLADLPSPPPPSERNGAGDAESDAESDVPGAGLSIKKRLSQTRFLTPVPETLSDEMTLPPGGSRRSLSRDLSLLYRLALDMGSANTCEELARIVLDGLLEAVQAEVGAVLAIKEKRDLEVTAHRHRDPSIHSYTPVSEFVSNEVIASREAILAEDVAGDRYLRQRESVQRLGATSLICAPVMIGDKVIGLIHLYCTDPLKSLNGDDLDFTVAVAKHLGNVIRQLKRQESLTAENRSLRDQLRVDSELVGDSRPLKDIEDKIGLVAGTNATVLIRGESGVGKELVARAIHNSSPRKDGPFVCLNCAAITETLLESELFGHEKGSFTGATEKKIGKFEAAHRGTIFLDEIGEMAPSTQAKLLRVLEGHPFERVGGHTPIRVDVRVVAATNQPLEKALQDGTFRRDLFFRLQVVEIRVPPLRDRKSDIPILAQHFLKRFVRETGRKIRGFSAAALHRLDDYPWPGNVRELKNAIERAVALGRGPLIDLNDLFLSAVDVAEPGGEREAPPPKYDPRPLKDVERAHVLQTLEFTDWKKSQAAAILGIERSTLDRKIDMYQLKRGAG